MTIDVIRLAKEAGIAPKPMILDGVEYEYQYVEFNDNIGGDEFGCIERFAALVAAAEREECAKLFDQPHKEYFGDAIQQAIRARKPA